MNRHLLYIIGPPGSGKSTLMAALVQGKRRRVRMEPFCHTVYYEDGLVQLGRERADFSGTDVLSMSVMPRAVAALETGMWPRIVAEGDRLASAKFFTSAKDAGYAVDVAFLECPEELAAARREERGSTQEPSWVQGRVTKVQRLADGFATIRLSAKWPVDELAAELVGHPVFQGESA